jgi:hypothetical protein
VKVSLVLVALVPPGVVTVMSTAPADPAGEVAVIEVALVTENDDAAVPPKWTAVAPVRFVPVIVTVVPPDAGPEVGLIELTVGAGMYVNWSDDDVLDVPTGLVTVMSTAPRDPAGETAIIEVPELTV